jgi:hypothetical protein
MANKAFQVGDWYANRDDNDAEPTAYRIEAVQPTAVVLRLFTPGVMSRQFTVPVSSDSDRLTVCETSLEKSTFEEFTARVENYTQRLEKQNANLKRRLAELQSICAKLGTNKNIH